MTYPTSHAATAAALTFILALLVIGVGTLAFVLWEAFWKAYDRRMERRIRARRERRIRLYIMAPPSHSVGRDVFNEFNGWRK